VAAEIESPQQVTHHIKGHAHHAPASRRGRVLHFLQHLGEMLVAMMLGMVLLMPVYGAIMRAFGYDHQGKQLPELSAFVMTFTMTLPMVAWMRFRGHDWARSGEMAGAMFLPAVVLLPLCVAGMLPHTALSAGVMIGVMLYRRSTYGG
jgi:hypothetical protein